MFGETAMLDGGGRSAGVVADSEATVYALTQDALHAIGREHPALAAQLYRNIAVHLSQRLRSAEGETALIERGGDLRQVSIASGNGF